MGRLTVTLLLAHAGWLVGEGDALRFHTNWEGRNKARPVRRPHQVQEATRVRDPAVAATGPPTQPGTRWQILDLPEDRRGPSISGAAAATLPDGQGGTYLFGGLSSTGAATNELWRFTERDGLTGGPGWELLEPAGTPPPPRMYSAAVIAHDNTLLIIGGWDPGAKGSGGTFLDDGRLDRRPGGRTAGWGSFFRPSIRWGSAPTASIPPPAHHPPPHHHHHHHQSGN